ncbi:amino acid adenylation domain-containing protein, partial [Francisella noatunensis subsp. orientalis]|nr:amino acid adenylation domain-containing protein [Francisella orientalis]NIB62588.1 amino acid adenylation domain-containing protein [Francisella orientalis]NIY51221.1 amino acid adenylation domain-containing protein [Francisella orientalis]NIY52692.1 amino acid adenylation domain-containing protein [Francisella orientalis]NIY54149.1 amino acid adenylation domain-containing protein [Francisella orientalis]
RDRTVYELFEEQVLKNPDAIAIVFEDQEVTYKELNERSNQLARYIRKQYRRATNQELKPDTLIPLCLERGIDMVIGILGVMKSGGVYVPMDPDYPADRLKHILSNTNAKLVITQNHIEYRFKEVTDILLISINEQNSQTVYQGKKATNLSQYSQATDLAYVIYTSGTTGLPKGVMIEHSSINSLVFNKNIDISESDVFAFLSSPVFDASVFEIFCSLLLGSKLIIPKDIRHLISSSKELGYFLRQNKVSILWLTKTLFDSIYIQNKDLFAELRYLIIGGEALDVNLINSLVSQRNKPKKIINGYGPTESTTFTTFYEITKEIEIESCPIGQPINNRKVYVLDEYRYPVPLGVVGELYIGGAGLARGYLNRDDLTAERFVSNPFATELDIANDYTRLYKTGDLVRWLPDGNLEYIGRNDFQVKIRGYRIELGEIENQLLKIEGINQVAVLAKENEETKSKYLVGYYVPQELGKFKQESLLEELSNVLPEYMVPSILVELESFPLTINGKLDRKKLSNTTTNFSNYTQFNPYDNIEKYIGNLWLKTLPIKPETLNSHSSFLNLGGNSLLVTKIVSSINNEFGIFLKASDLFKYRTLGELSQHVRENLKFSNKAFNFKLQKNIDVKSFSLTDVQNAYLFGRMEGLTLGNISTHVYIELCFDDINVQKLELAINKLIRRHEQLRTIININENTQSVIADVPVFHLNKENTQVIRQNMSHQVFDIGKYPLFDFKYSIDGSNKYILHCSFDAIITDVYSLSIIFNDLNSFYNDHELLKIEVSFSDYINFNFEFKQTKYYSDAREYWARKIPNLPKYPQLPLLNHPNNIKKISFSNLNREISKDIFSKLTDKATKLNISATSVLLFCYGFILSRFSGQNDCLINLTLFNREYFHKDIDKVVGDFTTLELFGFSLSDKNKLKNTLLNIHNDLWKDLDYKSYSGVEVIRDIRKYNKLSPNDLIAPYVFTSAIGHNLFPENFLGNKFEGISFESAQTSQCIIDNIARETKQGISIDWYYVEQLFDSEVISSMHKAYCDLIEYLAESDWEEKLPELILPELDRSIIEAANGYIRSEVKATLVELFTSSLESNLSSIAVIDYEGKYSYKTISDYANSISLYLHDHGLCKVGRLIGVLSEKSHRQVVVTLGIMQSGSGYLPLHVDWPRGRCDEVLSEGNVDTVLLSSSEFNGCIKGSDIEDKYNWLIIEDIINYKSDTKLESLSKLDLDDIAYVIFTSGSTGKPKGVTISHKGAVNTILAVNERFNINKQDKVLALSELSFDLSVYDIFGLLAAGGTIVFPDQKRTKEPSHWYDLIEQYTVTIWDTVPQLMSLLVDYVRDSNKQLPSLKVTLMSGDWIPLNLPKQIKEVCPNITVMSLGGATEGSIWSIWYEVNDIDPNWNFIPYGQAMPNQRMYVLNEQGQHNPIGVIGEIYIGGQGVAVGYWQDQEKTAASFINHPELGRLYKTGDLGKWHRDGYIVFEGRKDSQVKLNGYRVELDEISSKLAKLPGVENALVKIQETNNKSYLIGYLVSENDNKEHLSEISHDENQIIQYRINQSGIDNKLGITYSMDIDLLESDFRLRKSYRNFIDTKIYKYQIENKIDEVQKNISHQCSRSKNTINKQELLELLSKISGLKLEDKVIPKYRYPSGGSSYSVRTYINIESNIADIIAGQYYYNPIEKALCGVENKSLINKFLDKNAFHFVAHMPAIRPLYNDFSLKLTYIEMGHMLGLLIPNLNKLGISYKVELNSFIDERQDNIFLGSLVLFPVEETPQSITKFNFRILDHDKTRNAYVDENSIPLIKLKEESIFTRSGDFYQTHVMESANLLLSIDAPSDKKDNSSNMSLLVESCIFAQCLSESLYEDNIGSCMLGTTIDNGIYTVAFGKIDERQKILPETKVSQLCLKDLVNKELSNSLPNYMLPYDYIVLDHIPLTANGKVDYKLLPSLTINLDASYVKPRNDVEEKLCILWSNILELDQIGIHDSFLKLGGNSFTSIKLINEMKSNYNVNIQVSDLFKYPTIAEIVENFSFKEVSMIDEGEDEDILWI